MRNPTEEPATLPAWFFCGVSDPLPFTSDSVSHADAVRTGKAESLA